mmetsp:Transcript_33131/g.32257  ORF Transcript_33131/g.32257 Transcript_33131/m.32257 type:complete len:84 (+) Transcript_33131:47-298(+)
MDRLESFDVVDLEMPYFLLDLAGRGVLILTVELLQKQVFHTKLLFFLELMVLLEFMSFAGECHALEEPFVLLIFFLKHPLEVF